VAASDHDPKVRPGPDAAGDTDSAPAPGPNGAIDGATASAPIIDWARTARRIRAVLLVIGSTAVALWLVLGLLGDGLTLRLLAELAGIGILLVFAVEVVVVGGAAIRGMFTAGERGERLAGQDVFLLPPQLVRGRRRSDDQTG
jgi:hypothetical protein